MKIKQSELDNYESQYRDLMIHRQELADEIGCTIEDLPYNFDYQDLLALRDEQALEASMQKTVIDMDNL